MDDLLKIEGGTVYDPANGIEGEVRDLWARGGRMIAPPSDPAARPARVIRAAGRVVMPGGVDMHCHIAGAKVNAARLLRPEEKRNATAVLPRTAATRSGTLGTVPSTFATGYKYLGLGYTTAFDAAVPPLLARHAHEEFADTPGIDKGFYLLAGNNQFLLDAFRRGEHERARAFLGWLLGRAKGYGVKAVNPGGVEAWKQGRGGIVDNLDAPVPRFEVTPREILLGLARAVDSLRLPHPLHVHCNNLGMPGNWRTTLETMRALEGHRGHVTHIQFHSYAGGEGEESSFGSAVEPLVEYVNAHSNLTVDVGQVLFGEATSMTGDGAVGHYLHRVYGGKWINSETELEAGCGIVPIRYRDKSLVHACQWAIGLEWYLMMRDPWRIAMSTDHPNGGSFLAYPQIIRLLMDRSWRRDMLARLPAQVRERTQLADLDREYSLAEICIITRAAPARMLGLTHKGHLGPGADADLTLYTPHENAETMFSLPYLVLKAGAVVLEEGEPRDPGFGESLHVRPEYDSEVEPHIASWFAEHGSLQLRNYGVEEEELARPREVPCAAAGG